MIDLTNTKVYTTDIEVILKYGELCGVEIEPTSKSSIGYYFPVSNSRICYFISDSCIDTDYEYTEITEHKINALYDEKFGIKTETQEEKEALDNISTKESVEFKPSWAKWDLGDEVKKIKGSNWQGKIVGYYSTELTKRGYAVESSTEKGSVQIYPEAALELLDGKESQNVTCANDGVEWKNGDKCIFNDNEYHFIGIMPLDKDMATIWRCLDGNRVVYIDRLSNPESPEAKEDRARLEAAYDLYLTRYGENIKTYTYDEFLGNKHYVAGFLAVVDKTGYRLESK